MNSETLFKTGGKYYIKLNSVNLVKLKLKSVE